MSDKVFDLNDSTKAKSAQMKKLKDLIRLAEDYTRLKPIVDAIPAKADSLYTKSMSKLYKKPPEDRG